MSPAVADSTRKSYNINEASKACGLSPSVLRIWELRYGWPNPKRLANGYRAYSQHLINDLSRMAALVKGGKPIRQLIVDGLPAWPEDPQRPPQPRTIDATKRLQPPQDRLGRDLQAEVIEAVERRRGGAVRELIDRISWLVRPADEARTGLIPMVVGIAELATFQRDLGNHQAAVLDAICRRSSQILRSLSHTDQPWVVIPNSADDRALAAVTALALTIAGRPAIAVSDGEQVADATLILASSGDTQTKHSAIAQVSALNTDASTWIGDLIDRPSEISWL